LAGFARHVEALVGQVTNSGSETKSEQVAKGKYVISEARRVGIVFLDSQIGFVIKQAIKNMRRIAHRCINDLGMERRVLIGDVCVKGYSGVVSIF